jgi:hypothetical protein
MADVLLVFIFLSFLLVAVFSSFHFLVPCRRRRPTNASSFFSFLLSSLDTIHDNDFSDAAATITTTLFYSFADYSEGCKFGTAGVYSVVAAILFYIISVLLCCFPRPTPLMDGLRDKPHE